MPAPVALFVYNRLWHTRETVDSLRKNPGAAATDLYVFSDGTKAGADDSKVKEVRDYIKTITGFRRVEIKESDVNQGLAKAIISGVSSVLEKHESIIVLEDDMVTSPYFLTYMNEALNLYKNDDAVISIHGYIYPVKEKLPETFFLKGADCWGWATWKRGWALFEPDGSKLLFALQQKGLTNEFDFHGTYPYTRMLEKQISGQNNSWAIRWYAAAFLQEKLTLYPGKSLIRNIGNDTSGTHSWDHSRFDQKELAQSIALDRLLTAEDTRAKKIISQYFKSTVPPIYKKIIQRIKFMFK